MLGHLLILFPRQKALRYYDILIVTLYVIYSTFFQLGFINFFGN